jgi:hypothetical protein
MILLAIALPLDISDILVAEQPIPLMSGILLYDQFLSSEYVDSFLG